MNWLTNLLFGNKAPAEPQNPRDSLHTPKQNTPLPDKPDPHARYLRDTLHFAKQQHKQLQDKHQEQQRWQQHYGSLHIDELKKLSGVEFENYLAKLFTYHGYTVETTAITSDYGADLILHKDQQRIAIQAKCYTGSVGVSAVQEALSGMAYYRCHSALVGMATICCYCVYVCISSCYEMWNSRWLLVVFGQSK
jgi:restriction endonuclease Mrr